MYIDLVTIDLCPGQGGGGVKPSGTLEISGNGVYNVYSYSSASVDVHPSASLSETYISNGSYNITGEFNGGVITVDVPAPQFVTEPLNVSANGTYTPGQGVDGFSTVTVDVPQSVTGYTQKDITEGLCITNLNNSASFVKEYAFSGNSCLTTVDLPMCKTVGNNAFNRCYSLQTVSLPACTTVGDQAFYSCSSLQTVSLPVCTTVAGTAFRSCSSLQTVSLPACTTIGWYAFYNCYSLKTVSLPACTTVGRYTFQNCTSLSSIDLPMCKTVGNQAFQNCYSLSVVYIGTGIDTVCVLDTSNAFDGCSALTSIYVPASLVESYKTATNWTYYSDKIFGI